MEDRAHRTFIETGSTSLAAAGIHPVDAVLVAEAEVEARVVPHRMVAGPQETLRLGAGVKARARAGHGVVALPTF